ncbi:MAG: aminopeptidase N C-terminal domain-containing protein, partial [Pseudomonadota bacterium]
GYQFVAQAICDLDALNPQLAARVVTVFETWRRHDTARQSHAQLALEMIQGKSGLSQNSREMVDRILSSPA